MRFQHNRSKHIGKNAKKNLRYIKQHRTGALLTGFALGGLAAGLWYGLTRGSKKPAPLRTESIDERYHRTHPTAEREQTTSNGAGRSDHFAGTDPLPQRDPF